jgi:hypothetical protein
VKRPPAPELARKNRGFPKFFRERRKSLYGNTLWDNCFCGQFVAKAFPGAT